MKSGIGVFYPDKRPTQRVGIIPEIEAIPTSHQARRVDLPSFLERALPSSIAQRANRSRNAAAWRRESSTAKPLFKVARNESPNQGSTVVIASRLMMNCRLARKKISGSSRSSKTLSERKMIGRASGK